MAQRVGRAKQVALGIVFVGVGLARGVGGLHQIEVVVVGEADRALKRILDLDQQAAVVEVVGRGVAQRVGDGDLALGIREGRVLRAAVAVGIGQAALGVVTEVVVAAVGVRHREQGVGGRRVAPGVVGVAGRPAVEIDHGGQILVGRVVVVRGGAAGRVGDGRDQSGGVVGERERLARGVRQAR